MELQESIKVIEQALEIATSKGSFKLQDAAIIATALESLKLKTTPEVVEEIKEPIKFKK